MIMEQVGLYIYGIIKTEQDHFFACDGLQDERVYTLGHGSLAAIVSKVTYERYLKRTRKYILKHQQVIEEVMNEHDVLPVRFGTIAQAEREIRNLLERKQREFFDALAQIDHKIEVSVKGMWKNMDVIFEEIPRENAQIQQLKQRWQGKPPSTDVQIKVGELVEKALEAKKRQEETRVLERLKQSAIDYKLNKKVSDAMFFNASFMLSRDREHELDHLMEELDKEFGQEAHFKYISPLPLFSFIDITIKPEDWET